MHHYQQQWQQQQQGAAWPDQHAHDAVAWQQQQYEESSSGGGPKVASRTAAAAAAPPLLDKAAALERYRQGPGAGKAQLLNDNHSKMRAVKRGARELALKLNGLKKEIDNLKEAAGEIKAAWLAREGKGAQVGVA